MADAVESGSRVFALGNVFSRAFAAMGGAAATIFGVSFLLTGIPQAIWGYVLPTLMVGAQPGDMMTLITLGIFGGFIVLALNMLVQAALVRVVIAHGEGRSVSMAQAMGTSFAFILPLLGLVILASFGMMLGFMLLFVPGIIVGIMWSVSGPALVDERTGIIGALGRSRYLTKGARWKIFGLMVLLVVIMWVALMVVGLLMVGTGNASYGLGQTPTMLAQVIGLILNTVLGGFWATMLTALFIELRNWKDGLDPGNLQEVFA